MERKKRSSYDIIYDILESCKYGVKKTRLMYNANLSFQVLEKYVIKLTEKGLILKKEDKFFITEKGIKYLETIKRLKEKKKELEEIYTKLREI
jgi:predicted transcriptional regulator